MKFIFRSYLSGWSFHQLRNVFLLKHWTTLSLQNVWDMAKASALILLLAITIGMLLLLNSGRVQGNPIVQIDEHKAKVIIQDGLENLRGKYVFFFTSLIFYETDS